jgi:hypothetical protein
MGTGTFNWALVRFQMVVLSLCFWYRFGMNQIQLQFVHMQQGKTHVLYAPALDISTCGASLKAAEKSFAQLVPVFLSELKAMGTLDAVLTELGWKKVKKSTRSPFGYVPPRTSAATTSVSYAL